MEKITPKDLMIGDWVNDPIDSDVNWKWEADDFTDIDEVYPVLLTEEILLKNGFKKTGVHHKTRFTLIQNPDTPMVNFISVCTIGKTTIKYHSKNGEWIKGINLRIKYVHELQHALRLCGMNDLADKFRLY